MDVARVMRVSYVISVGSALKIARRRTVANPKPVKKRCVETQLRAYADGTIQLKCGTHRPDLTPR